MVERRASFFGRTLTKRQSVALRAGCLALLLAGAGAAVAGLPHLMGQDPPAAAEAAVLAVQTVVVEFQDTLQTERSYTGVLAPRRRSALAFERPGLLQEVRVDDGDAVDAGAVLARLDDTQLRVQKAELVAQHAAAEAQLAELVAGPRAETISAAAAVVREREANVAFWSRELTRFEQLRDDGQATQKELDDAHSQQAMAQAQLDAARAQLQELAEGTRREQIDAQRARVAQLAAGLERVDVELRKSALVAPFSGRVARRAADEGAVVAAGQGVIELIEAGALEARIGVPPNAASRLVVGEQHDLQVDAAVADGVIRAILPELDAATRTTTVVLDIPNAPAGFVAQRIVRLALPERTAQRGTWLPLTALAKGRRGLWSAYALVAAEGDGWAVERRDVEVLYTAAERAYVRGLLCDGERVIATGLPRVAPGQRVKPVD